LTDHRALREQLHTIRTASLEERHGSESDWKAEKHVTQIENLRTILHKFTDINEQEFDQTRTSNPDIQKYASLSLVRTILSLIKLFNPGVSRLQSKLP